MLKTVVLIFLVKTDYFLLKKMYERTCGPLKVYISFKNSGIQNAEI